MTEDQVWETIGRIPIGTIIAWAVVIIAIIVGICAITIKLYKTFCKYKSYKDENDKQKAMIAEHDMIIKQINASLKEIKESLYEQKDVNLKQMRHTIVHTCDDAIAEGNISAGKLKSLEELFEEYVDIFHGNGYVKNLVERVRQLPIVGKLDD